MIMSEHAQRIFVSQVALETAQFLFISGTITSD